MASGTRLGRAGSKERCKINLKSNVCISLGMLPVFCVHLEVQVRQLQAVDRQGPDDLLTNPGARVRGRGGAQERRPVLCLRYNLQLLLLLAQV